MATTPLSSSSATMAADTKISNDLAVLREKMDLLETMLHPPDAATPKLSVRNDEAVRAVIGYLDACAPRMIELVTACTSRMGVLSEEVFGDVLGCNDRLQKLLSDVDTRMMTETTASTTIASAPSSSNNTAAAAASVPSADLADQFGDLLLGNEDPFAEAHGSGTAAPAAGAKTTGETDEDFEKDMEEFFQQAAPPASAPPPLPPTSGGASSAASDDPFDDFFAERTESNFK